MKRLVFVLGAVAMMAQITQPVTGYIVDRQQALRPVLGMAGNFVLGEAIGEGVLSVASSGKVTLAKTQDEVWFVSDGRVAERKPAPAGKASFTFDKDGSPLAAEFYDAEVQWRWSKDGIVESALEKPAASLSAEIDLPESLTRVRLEQMGAGWLAAYTESGIFAIRKQDGKVYQLPELLQ